MMKIQKPKTKLGLTIGIIVLLAVGAAAYFWASHHVSKKSGNSTSTRGINYGPPTKADTQSVNDNKQRIVQKEQDQKNQAPPSQGAKQSIKPTITYAGQYGSSVEVGGYINVFETDGTCTATFTHSSTVLTKSVAAVRDVNSTDCPAISLSSSEFVPKGTYSVTLGYSSATTTGTSDPKTIEVK